MNATSVSAGYAKALFDMAVAKGADAGTLAQRSGLDPVALDNPDKRVAFSVFKALMHNAKLLCDDPAFGLHFGEESLFVDMSIVGLICHAAETMGAAFHEMNRYARLAVEVEGHDVGDRFALQLIDGATWLVDQRRSPNEFPELTESTFARFICDTRRYHGAVPFARQVHFTHAAPAYRAEYDRIMQVPLTFDSNRNAICIDESWLAIPINNANRYVFGILSDRAAALLAELEQNDTMRGRVEKALMPFLHTGKVGMDEIAANVGVSRMTLYRRLKHEGTSYEAVLDALRHTLALHYLNGNKVSVNEAAYLVGFSDPASFSRAFKRWTGHPPSKAGKAAAQVFGNRG